MRYVIPAAAVLLCGIALPGCKGYLDFGPWDWDAGAVDGGPADAGTDGDADADAGLDAAGADGGCPGICAKKPALWDGPWLFWSGNAGQAPPCPHDDPGEVAWRGNADLIVPAACEPCLCGPSSGACELPSKLTASTNPCNGGVQPIPFDAPAGWDGACDNTNSIGAGVGVKSLWISPVAVTQESCSVVDPTGPVGPVKTSWKKEGILCHGAGWSSCGDSNAICIPAADTGFRICIAHLGDEGCPSKDEFGYTERHVFYMGVDDQRKCTECACGPPTGSMCTAQVSIYQDNDTMCSGAAVGSVGISSVMPSCLSINPPGQPLGSKTATPPSYIAGTCNPIPAIVEPDGGTATPTEPVTICCKP